jgi:GntR family histidine utilization transcriptional repressor
MKATYKEVKSDILAKIVKGDWGPGDLVPNEVDLAVTYGCARATVNRAMRELADDGIIERRRKAGTRVRMTQVRQARFDIPLVRDEVTERGAAYRYSLVSHEVEIAPDWLRAQLQLPVGGKALHLVCMHSADGVPYETENRWINMAALPAAEDADFSQECPTEWVLAAIPFTKAEINLSAELADQKLSDYLACSVGDPVFSVERSTWWEGDAVTYVRLTYRPGYRLTTRY